jgi:SAM-dependent methyltransferase
VSVLEDAVHQAGRAFARMVTNIVVRVPALWPLLRGPLRAQFDRLAPRWETMMSDVHMAPYESALEAIDPPPRRALDLGTGTGVGAFAIARRFPGAEVVGADLAERMVAEATKNTPQDLAGRVRFEAADASRLPYADGFFDLVALGNMIPFFDELARVVAPGGAVLLAFSGGAGTPIYVPPERLRDELGRRGFAEFADFAAGNGTALVARKARPG